LEARTVALKRTFALSNLNVVQRDEKDSPIHRCKKGNLNISGAMASNKSAILYYIIHHNSP